MNLRTSAGPHRRRWTRRWDHPVTVRMANAEDAEAITLLAERDSRPVPAAPRLVAERCRRIEAALSAAHGRGRRRSLPAHAPQLVRASCAAAPSVSATPAIRRDLRPGDLGRDRRPPRRRPTCPSTGSTRPSRRTSRASVAAAGKRGFPGARERLWIVELGGRHAGSLALTDEGDGLGAVRWFVLDPRAARPRPRPPADRRAARPCAEAAGYRELWPRDVQRPARRGAHLPLTRLRGDVGGHRPALGPRAVTYQRYELSFQRRAQSRARASAGSSAAALLGQRVGDARPAARPGPSARPGRRPRARAAAARAAGPRARAPRAASSAK